VHQDGRGAEAPGKRPRVGELRRTRATEGLDETGRAAAPAVDRLLGIADEEEPPAIGPLAEDGFEDGREGVVAALRACGYRYVTVDLEGFRSGNLNA